MTHSTNLNGMRSIILYNIFRQSKRLTQENKKSIIDFVNTLSIDGLKKKGLTKQIVTQFKNGKPRKILIGVMNNGIDLNAQTYNVRRRHRIDRVVGWFHGKHYSDEINTVAEQEEAIKTLIDNEREAIKRYENAVVRTRQAQQQEKIAHDAIEIAQKEKMRYIDGVPSLIKEIHEEEKLKKFLIDQNEKFKFEYQMKISRNQNKSYDDKKILIDLRDQLQINDIFYYVLTNDHLQYKHLFPEEDNQASSSSDQPPAIMPPPSVIHLQAPPIIPPPPSVIHLPAPPIIPPPPQPQPAPPLPAPPEPAPPQPAQPAQPAPAQQHQSLSQSSSALLSRLRKL